MENYLNNFWFTYFPHIAFAVFWFGLFTRFILANNTIQAKSTQLLSNKSVKWGSNLFHYGIIVVFFGHFTLFLPESIYHLVMSTETKRAIAIIFGSFFGIMSFIGLIILVINRTANTRLRINSGFADYFILILLLVETVLGLISVTKTASSPLDNYTSLGLWAQKVITFQPEAGEMIANHSIMYKVHFITGLLIFMIFPYTKLMHILVYPLAYFFRSGYQLVRKGKFY
ncbi:MAG: respiratory nitrate reductase subunit gamma [Draconibacterium sp.]